MHLMTCRPRRLWFITGNKTDLEYIMFLVNLMPRHQRPGERGPTEKKNKTRAEFLSKTSVTQRFTVETKQLALRGGPQHKRSRALIRDPVLLSAGSTWFPWHRRPHRTSRSEGECTQVAVPDALWGFFKQGFSPLLVCRALRGRKDQPDPEAPRGPW